MKEACKVFGFFLIEFKIAVVHKWLINEVGWSWKVGYVMRGFIVTELVGHGRLSHDFRASCVFMPTIRTPVFRVKLKRERDE